MGVSDMPKRSTPHSTPCSIPSERVWNSYGVSPPLKWHAASQIPEPLLIFTSRRPLKVQISQGQGPFFQIELFLPASLAHTVRPLSQYWAKCYHLLPAPMMGPAHLDPAHATKKAGSLAENNKIQIELLRAGCIEDALLLFHFSR